MTRLALLPLAVTSAPVLRAIQAGGWTTAAELADRAGRLANNISRDLRALETEGLIVRDPAVALTDLGREQLAAIDRAEGEEASAAGAVTGDPLALSLLHAQIVPDPDNHRRDWASDDARLDLLALRMDIVEHGLHQNLLVRPMTAEEVEAAPLDCAQDAALAEGLPLYRLVAGERRWRAIGEAMDEDDWPVRRPIPCRLLEADALGVRIAALSENLQRRDLNPMEKARGFEDLAVEGGLSNQDIADRFNKTPEHVQQHRSFLRLSEADQVRLTLPRDDPRRLTVRQAREKVAQMNREAAPVPALDVSPVARLTAAEILHAVHRRAGYTYDDIEVGRDAADDAWLSELVAAGMVRAPVLREHGVLQGRWVLSLCHAFPFAAFPALRAGSEADFDAGLAAERARLEQAAGTSAEVSAERPYLAAWLNGPFELTAEGQALIDARQARLDEEAARNAEAARLRREVLDAQAAVVARARALFAESRVATVAGRVDADVAREIAITAEAPLPWRVSHDGGVVAADGSPVIGGGGTDRGEARMRLLVLAVNAAGRVETPEDEAPEPEQDIDGFDPDAADPADDDEEQAETFDEEEEAAAVGAPTTEGRASALVGSGGTEGPTTEGQA